MSQIIAGDFEQRSDADAAVKGLRAAGVRKNRLCVFGVSPPGQHDRFPIGGDRDESPGTKRADAGAGAGAYVGSLVGTLNATDGEGTETMRRAGVIVAVNVADPAPLRYEPPKA